MDHMLKIKTPARVGFTSIIENASSGQVFYGGCSVNIAYGLCQLGHLATPVLRVGPDWEDNGFRDFLVAGGVPLDATSVVEDEATSACYLIQDSAGEHITCFYPGSMDARHFAPLDPALFGGARLGVITVASLPDNREFYRCCREAGVPVVFGMKSDEEAFPRDFLDELLHGSRIIFTNEAERDAIVADFGLADICDLFERGEAEVIVTTAGGRGSTYYRKDPATGQVESACVPVCAPHEIVDCTGGGDAYMAGFLAGVLEGRPLASCCRMGSTLSSFVLEREGCCTGMPDRTRFDARYEQFSTCCHN